VLYFRPGGEKMENNIDQKEVKSEVTIKEPTEKERKDIIKACKKADTIHKVITEEKNKSFKGQWIDDSERFLAFSYIAANELNKHSKRLTCWTIVIAVFTIVLGLSTIWTIIDKFLL
jgi:hypothetical protein